jgi:hypothetical protein
LPRAGERQIHQFASFASSCELRTHDHGHHCSLIIAPQSARERGLADPFDSRLWSLGKSSLTKYDHLYNELLIPQGTSYKRFWSRLLSLALPKMNGHILAC